MEEFEHQMQVLMTTEDDMEKKEGEYANLLAEEQHLACELETLNDRTKNM